MKAFRRIAAMVLAVLTVASLAGCSALGVLKKEENPDKAAIIGTWKADIDFSEALAEEMAAEDDESAQYYDFSGAAVALNMQFNEDDTYSMYIDEASVNAFSEAIYKSLCDGVVNQFNALGADAGMTSDDILSASGYDTVEAFVDDNLDADAFASAFTDMITNTEGCYVLKDGMLFTSDTKDAKPATNAGGEPYTLSGNTLTLSAAEGEDVPEFMQTLVFTRQ